jgi:hypothetical protein
LFIAAQLSASQEGLSSMKLVNMFNPLDAEFLVNSMYNSVRTSQETHYVSATKTNRLMLFGETVAVYCENHTEHINTLGEQNAGFQYIKARDI